jgi:hypothetical protein
MKKRWIEKFIAFFVVKSMSLRAQRGNLVANA